MSSRTDVAKVAAGRLINFEIASGEIGRDLRRFRENGWPETCIQMRGPAHLLFRRTDNAIEEHEMQANMDKGYKGMGMEGRVAHWYARNTARDLPDFAALAQRVSAPLAAGSRVLEVAPGPGYLAIEIARRGRYHVVGLDISRTFVEIAARNARAAHVDVDFRQGNASAMPFPDNTFDLIVCRAAFKNFSRPVAAMNEMYRVLNPGGRALIVDLRKDASLEDINAYIRHADLGWANSIIYKATFRYLLLPRAYSQQQFADMAAESTFAGAHVDASGIGFEVTLQKDARRRSG